MSIYVKRLASGQDPIPELGVKVAINGINDITSELSNTNSIERSSLQGKQVLGELYFFKDAKETAEYPPLVIAAPILASSLEPVKVTDVGWDPISETKEFASPLYYDSQARPFKVIEIDASGAYEIDFWGSIDSAESDETLKSYSYLGRAVGTGEPGLFRVSDIEEAARAYRYIKVEQIRGRTAKIQFQAIFT